MDANRECILIYKFSKFEKKIRLFGEKFSSNNKLNGKIIINGVENQICEFYLNANSETNITVKLIMNNNIADLSYMFNGCTYLSSISEIFKWNTTNIISMKWMFFGCNSLESIPDISNWDISNVTDIQFMFSGCSQLTSLPDISKWNTKNISNMSGLFSQCSGLKSLPDLSKWDMSNVININNIFSFCKSLQSLPDISKWDTKNIKNMSYIFHECLFLLSLSDISKWNTSSVINMSYMFSKCVSLSSLPDISKWEIKNVIDISFMFSQCLALSSIPDISKWNTSNILDMNSLFFNCSLLTSLPDLSKWNTINVTNMNKMFSLCSSLKRLPDISKWNTSNVIYMTRMFSDCSSLVSIPNISLWDYSSVEDKSFMFFGCKYDFLKEKLFDNNYNNNIINNINNEGNLFSFNKKNIIRNENLKFIPQIEIKFNNVNNITPKMIQDLKEELKNLLKEENFSIIEIKKGSLTVIIALQFIIFNEIKRVKESNLNLNINIFSKQFSKLKIEEEVKKISKAIKNNTFISVGTTKPDFVYEDIILLNEENKKELKKRIDYISRNNSEVIEDEESTDLKDKILDLSFDFDNPIIEKDDNDNSIDNNDNENNDFNIYEMSNNINIKIEDLEEFYKKITKDCYEQENNQFRLIHQLEEFNTVFDIEIEKALKNSIFEFKIIHIFLLDKDKDIYIREKNKCANREIKILYHGTIIDYAVDIVSEKFKPSKKGAIGRGVYLTDLLDYACNYARKEQYFGNIPKVGESFTFVASEIYYDNNQIEDINNINNWANYNYDNILILPVKKNGVRCCYGFFNGKKLLNEIEATIKIRPIGKEYLITEESQILPLYAVTVKRLEYLVIWRDYNFSSDNPNKYSWQVFQEMQNFHREIKKIITREFDSKVYYTKTTEEALELIERKKYNKIIIITNGNNNAINFIKNARKIIGAETIVAVSAYNIPAHIPWVRTMNNAFLLNGIDFHSKFIKAIMKNEIGSLNRLRNEVINYYTPEYPYFELKEFNRDLLNFPKFKVKGRYDDLRFNTVDNKKCIIF